MAGRRKVTVYELAKGAPTAEPPSFHAYMAMAWALYPTPYFSFIQRPSLILQQISLRSLYEVTIPEALSLLLPGWNIETLNPKSRVRHESFEHRILYFSPAWHMVRPLATISSP